MYGIGAHELPDGVVNAFGCVNLPQAARGASSWLRGQVRGGGELLVRKRVVRPGHVRHLVDLDVRGGTCD